MTELVDYGGVTHEVYTTSPRYTRTCCERALIYDILYFSPASWEYFTRVPGQSDWDECEAFTVRCGDPGEVNCLECIAEVWR